MALSKETLDQLTAEFKTPQELQSAYSQMLQHMINRALEGELQAHLGHERHGRSSGNTRNGKIPKTVLSTDGALEIETPRDRDGTFEPQLVKKRQVRLFGMEEKILALYARGMTTRDIESALVDLYGVTISHALIAQVTDVVLDEARAWQTRPLESIYPIVWLDGIVVKVQQNKQGVNKSAYVVLGVNLRGEKEVLGLWLAENEGAKFWLSVLTELKHRGVQDIYIACMDGLKGLPEAVSAAFPKTLTQLCVVHLVRASLRYVGAKDSKAVVAGLKRIYGSATAEEAARELGQHHSVLPVSAADQKGDLHDECDRVAEHGDAQTDAEPSNLSERRLGAEVVVFGDSGSIKELESDSSLEAGATELPDDVRRRARAVGGAVKISVTQFV